MNPTGLKLPENLELRTVLEKMNRRKRELLTMGYHCQNSEDPDYSLSAVAKRTPTFKQVHEHRDIDFLIFLENKMVKLRESDYDHSLYYTKPISKLLEKETILKSTDKYKKPPYWPITTGENIPSEALAKLQGRNWFVIDLILCLEVAKIIPIYERLIPSDKEAVIKNSLLTAATFTQSYYSNLVHSDTIVAPDGFRPIVYAGSGRTPLHEDVFCRVIEPLKRINLTSEEYVLLKAIMLCNPAAKDLSHKGRKILEKESNRYGQLLLKHMQENLGPGPGAVKYSNMMQIFEAMSYFAQKSRELCIWITIYCGDVCNLSKKFKIVNEIIN